MQDRIERSVQISAPLERVWKLVSEPGWWVTKSTSGEVRQAGFADNSSGWEQMLGWLNHQLTA